MHGMSICLFISVTFIAEAAGVTYSQFYIKLIAKQDRVPRLLAQCSFICSAGLSVSSNLQGHKGCCWRSEPSSHSPPSLSWQVNRIEEMTSVIPSMLTIACWIQRPMNAGRSLQLTRSGTIGTASTCFSAKPLPNSFQKPLEYRKLTLLLVITFTSTKQRFSNGLLKQLSQLRSDVIISCLS